MIPSVLAHQLQQGIEDFLKTTFPISTPHFHSMLERFFLQKDSLFKGPYLSIQLPFRQGGIDRNFFPDVPAKNQPYLHQEQAFKRLSGAKPLSTIVATGTGSGKTESFLFPVLDHCYRHRGEPGIKGIFIYPMNALATDQAARIAKIICENDKLKANVSAGLYVGRSEKDPHMAMGKDHIITHKDTLRNRPPDILLTNYKMLDYLLIRARDFPLWKENQPETFQYLVVDELHTFDGAQGTDLACLIRRLKARLNTPKNFLCCVGTSATLGSDKEKGGLCEYAGQIFGEKFDMDSIIVEDRLHPDEFFEEGGFSDENLTSLAFHDIPEDEDKLNADAYDNHDDYMAGQYLLWFDEKASHDDFKDKDFRVKLGKRLKGNFLFKTLLQILGGQTRSYDEIIEELIKTTPELENRSTTCQNLLIDSLMSLVSSALIEKSGSTTSFLNVRYQVWMREMRRMVGSVSQKPELVFSADLNAEQLGKHLPLIHCRECSSMGWAGIKREQDTKIKTDLMAFYNAWFQHSPQIVFLFPEQGRDHNLKVGGKIANLCPECLHLTRNDASQNREKCASCDKADTVSVFIPELKLRTVKKKRVPVFDCPWCGANSGMTILGSRAASLTSVLIAQLYSSTFNDDKKILTFSDSVQDAAHRAGFFQGRTFRFNFRSTLQQFVQDGGDGLTLDEFPDFFIKYWSEKLDEKTFIATFLPPDMAWFEEYEYLKIYGRLKKGSRLKKDVEKRIRWEIISEYGFRARIGRTLEKTGSSVGRIDLEKLKLASEIIFDIIKNEIGGMDDLTENIVKIFLSGFILTLKNRGGIFQPALENFIDGWGNVYAIKNNKKMQWMPRFGAYSRIPVFLTTKRKSNFDHMFSYRNLISSWYEDWVEKCFAPIHIVLKENIRYIYETALRVLVDQKIFELRTKNKERIWGIAPSALRVSENVCQLKCGKCLHNISIADVEEKYWQKAPCLRFRCKGHYESIDQKIDYYSKLYSSGDIKRIFAAEHTGMLERDEREELEKSFKQKAKNPWDPNLLSCTPTLEMGIDIGDLSSLILCSVPPGQTNYIQRIGRSGRKDGNALNLTIASAKPHDLYFYAQPDLMIAGVVEPPGIFLDASAVLERQFTAYCMDKWVEAGTGETVIPGQIRHVLLNLKTVNIKKFPHNFLYFIETNLTRLYEGFIEIFEGELSKNSVKWLKTYISKDGSQESVLASKIKNGLKEQLNERESLKRQITNLNGKIKKKKNQTAKDKNWQKEIDELSGEKQGLAKLVKRINARLTLNFFTDEGLLPNYAFPEAGVMLRSIIWRKREKIEDGKSKYKQEYFDCERPAVSAIRELAPLNIFYAKGRKVCIDQVNLDVSNLEIWRFCDNCAFMSLTGIADCRNDISRFCPDCGSRLWTDAGQVRKMVRIRQVIATAPDRESRLSDDSDNRDPKFYDTRMLVTHNEQHITDAYKIDSDEMPFGFEFLSKAMFREINFGEKEESGEKVSIAGADAPKKGFVICKYCGKVQTSKGEIKHSLSCSSRNKASEKNLMESVWMYREFSSEAIRILMPMTAFDGGEKKIHSFVAALHLGLKLIFGGNVEHLKATTQDEPVVSSNDSSSGSSQSSSSYRKKYLVIYDSVPGGTGYLKQLMRSEKPMIKVIKAALDYIKACPCNLDTEKDGCYRCLFAYRRSFTMPETSRSTAVTMLSEILKYENQLVPTDSLKNIKIKSTHDSDLEKRFIEALEKVRERGIPVSLSNDTVNGKPGYFYKIGNWSYNIELRAKLGPADGVKVGSKPDFIFHHARTSKGMKPVAIFTDGFDFHKDRIKEDMIQRNAITAANKLHIWSLSSKDVENQFKPRPDYYDNYLGFTDENSMRIYNKFIEEYNVDKIKVANRKDSFECLIMFLQNPVPRKWAIHTYVHGLARLEIKKYSSPESIKKWYKGLVRSIPARVLNILSRQDRFYGLYETENIKLYITLKKEALKKGDISGMNIICFLIEREEFKDSEEFKSAWNGFLRLFNMFQFIQNVYFITGNFSDSDIAVKTEEPESGEWEEIFELTDENIHPLLKTLLKKGWKIPKIGFDLTDDMGRITGEAELAWEEDKIAVTESEESLEAFKNAGWEVFLLKDVIDDCDKTILRLNRRFVGAIPCGCPA